MIETIFLSVVIFLEILEYLVFLDVILSWLMIFWLKLRPKFLRSILDPIYSTVKKYIPTRFGAFDFTPIVVILLIVFLRGLFVMYVPWVWVAVSQLIG